MKITFPLLSLLCLAGPLWAQQARDSTAPGPSPVKPELPSGPLLRPAAPFSQWEITFSYPDDQKKDKGGGTEKTQSPAADARPRRILTTKTEQIVHEETIDVLNRKKVNWFKGATQYTQIGNDPIWYQTEPGAAGGSSYQGLPTSGFRDMELVQTANYAGTIPYRTGKSLVFVPGGYQKLDLNNTELRQKRLEAADTIAYVDEETRMPIAVKTRSESRVFRFDPPPTEMQSLPADLADQIRRGQEGRAKLEAPAARPF